MPPGASTRAISSHQAVTGCRLTTRSNVSSAKGSGGSSESATTATPRGRSRVVARATFGGQDSVATVRGGSTGAEASTSPPPVWMSSAAPARAIRPAMARA